MKADTQTIDILLLGSGGREHALAAKLAASPRAGKLYIAPGNGGTASCGENVVLDDCDPAAVAAFAQSHGCGLVVIGPEAPLVAGVADAVRAAGIPCFGPGAEGAQMEGSKLFSKQLMERAGIPTAAYGSFTDEASALAYVREQRHSRLPVYADSVDNVIGILQIRKYIKACIKAGGKAVDIRPLLDEPVFVHQSTLIAEVLPELSRRKANLAIVTDNYGGTLGIVTVEDIVEELVGEIWDEDDVVEESFVPLGGGRYEVDAEMTVGEVFDRLDYTDPEDDEELCYKLLGEWTYEQFSYIPREREGFRYHRLDVRISDMRQKRIVKLIVRLLPEEPDEAAAAEAAPEKGGEPA